MSTRLLLSIIALFLAAPLAAQGKPDPAVPEAAEAPEAADAWCPRGDRDLPRGPEWNCYGRLNRDYSFTFVYPKSVERDPVLDGAVRTEAGRAESWILAQVVTAVLDERESSRMSYEAGWTVDAMLPEIAAASGTISHYTGGAHGGMDYKTILIDRREGREIQLSDLFDLGDFETTAFGYRPWGMRSVQAAMCAALTAEARERRSDPSAAIECPAVERVPIALLCGANGRIDTMRALLNPYVVGAWAEGPYEVDFPIDAAMIAAMKRRFRPAFGLRDETAARIPARPCT
jgi:hypothetical protein